MCIHRLNLLYFLRCVEMSGLVNNCNRGLHDVCALLFKQGQVTAGSPSWGGLPGFLRRCANRALRTGSLRRALSRAFLLSPCPSSEPRCLAFCCPLHPSAWRQLLLMPWLHHSPWSSSDALTSVLALLGATNHACGHFWDTGTSLGSLGTGKF